MFDFGKLWLIARRELAARFKSRAYQVTVIFQILIALVAAVSPVLMARFTGGEDRVLIVDAGTTGAIARLTELTTQDGSGLPAITFVQAESADEARQSVEKRDAEMAVVVTTGQDGDVAYQVYNRGSNVLSPVQARVNAALQSYSVELAAQQNGVPQDAAQALLRKPTVTVTDPAGESGGSSAPFSGENTAAYGVAYVCVFLIYMAIVMLGQWIAQSVVEEKSSRIMEIIVNAANPRDLLAGKVLGVLGAGLCMIVPMLLVGAIGFSQNPRLADALDVSLPATMINFDFEAVSVKTVVFFLIYFLLGFLLFGALYAAVGSMVSRQEEVSQVVGPIMMVVILAFFGGISSLAVPDSSFVKVLMYVPLSSPFVAIPRILLGTPSVVEIVSSIVILAVAAVLAMWLAGRIYRVGILHYGQRLKFITLLRRRGMPSVAR